VIEVVAQIECAYGDLSEQVSLNVTLEKRWRCICILMCSLLLGWVTKIVEDAFDGERN
jgi:hypothetical protein